MITNLRAQLEQLLNDAIAQFNLSNWKWRYEWTDNPTKEDGTPVWGLCQPDDQRREAAITIKIPRTADELAEIFATLRHEIGHVFLVESFGAPRNRGELINHERAAYVLETFVTGPQEQAQRALLAEANRNPDIFNQNYARLLRVSSPIAQRAAHAMARVIMARIDAMDQLGTLYALILAALAMAAEQQTDDAAKAALNAEKDEIVRMLPEGSDPESLIGIGKDLVTKAMAAPAADVARDQATSDAAGDTTARAEDVDNEASKAMAAKVDEVMAKVDDTAAKVEDMARRFEAFEKMARSAAPAVKLARAAAPRPYRAPTQAPAAETRIVQSDDMSDEMKAECRKLGISEEQARATMARQRDNSLRRTPTAAH